MRFRSRHSLQRITLSAATLRRMNSDLRKRGVRIPSFPAHGRVWRGDIRRRFAILKAWRTDVVIQEAPSACARHQQKCYRG